MTNQQLLLPAALAYKIGAALGESGQYDEVPYAQCTILRNVKKGDYVKRKADSNKVYIKGDYDRASKSYSLTDVDDHCREVFIKASKAVFVGFTY